MHYMSDANENSENIDDVIHKFIKEDKGSPVSKPPMSHGIVHFLLIQVRDETFLDAERNVGTAIEICHKMGGTIMAVASSFLFVTFGATVQKEDNVRDSASAASEHLSATLGNNVKIISFSGNTAYGIYGTSNFMVYGAIIPIFDRYLGELCRVSFGQIVEMGD